jgi:hypothetical protein
MLGRYVIFAYDDRRPRGGWNDILRNSEGEIISFEEIQSLRTFVDDETKMFEDFDDYQVVDLQTGQSIDLIKLMTGKLSFQQ